MQFDLNKYAGDLWRFFLVNDIEFEDIMYRYTDTPSCPAQFKNIMEEIEPFCQKWKRDI